MFWAQLDLAMVLPLRSNSMHSTIWHPGAWRSDRLGSLRKLEPRLSLSRLRRMGDMNEKFLRRVAVTTQGEMLLNGEAVLAV